MATAQLVVVLEAQTARFSAAMSEAQRHLDRMNRPAQNARRGINLLQNATQNFAFSALGIPGPVGKVAQAIGMLGIGSPLMLAIMAGLAAGGLAAKAFAKDLEDLGRAGSHLDALNQALARIRAERIAEADPFHIEKMRRDLGLIEAELRKARAQMALHRSPLAVLLEAELGGVNRLAQEHQRINNLLLDREAIQRRIALAEDKELEARLAEIGKLTSRMQQEALRLPIPQVNVVIPPLAEAPFAPPVLTGQPPVRGPGGLLPVEMVTGAEMTEGLRRAQAAFEDLGRSLDLASVRAEQLGVAAIHAFAGIIQSLRGGGGVGGFFGGLLSAVGGVVSAANPLVGAALTAGGGLLGALTRQDRRPQPVRDDAARQELVRVRRELEAAQRRRPQNVSIIVVDSRGNPRDFLARLQRDIARGATGPLPVGVP
ncbi:MAG TPA: hypothetical protein VNL98_04790 [Gemmatimonadales bacterium]|nr:hypothetical protein [Gemmatimonadales bacterium]